MMTAPSEWQLKNEFRNSKYPCVKVRIVGRTLKKALIQRDQSLIQSELQFNREKSP
jgi:hypothetical protein